MAAVNALGALGAGFSTPNPSGFSSLSAEDFTRIILQELSRQDPLQPSDTNSLIQQISGVRSIQSGMDLSERLESLVSQNEFASATTVIGSRVSGVSVDNERVEGVVRSVTRTSYGALLTLEDSTRILMSDVDQIEAPPVEPTP
jgi:flagellar basal-body rod modification protein FlgD